MFKNAEQVENFVNLLERFTKAVIENHNSYHVEDAMTLNRMRDEFESFITAASGITVTSNINTTDTLVCPECGADMALRTNKSNGNKFWGCKKYPNCRGTRDEDGLSKAEREEQKYKKENVAQESGFSFNRDKRNPATEVSPPFNPFDK